MFSVIREFKNEKGNLIQMTVTATSTGVTVNAYGPQSTVEHTWTHKEAGVMLELLTFVRDNSTEPKA